MWQRSMPPPHLATGESRVTGENPRADARCSARALRERDAGADRMRPRPRGEPATDVGKGSLSRWPDWNARGRVLEIYADQGLGRPGSTEEEPGEGLVLRRSLVFPYADYEHILALIEEHGVGSLHPQPDGGVEVVPRAEPAATEPDCAACHATASAWPRGTPQVVLVFGPSPRPGGTDPGGARKRRKPLHHRVARKDDRQRFANDSSPPSWAARRSGRHLHDDAEDPGGEQDPCDGKDPRRRVHRDRRQR
jgi:hypothetical protein